MTYHKLIVFGASGCTGLQVVQQALQAGLKVSAFVRSPAKLQIQHPALVSVQGDVLDASAVDQVIQDHDAVISTLGPSRPAVPGMMQHAARNILGAMERHGLKRLIVTSGAGVRAPQDQPQLMDHVIKGLLTLLAGEVLRDSEAGVDLIRSSQLDWTVVRFPRLLDGPHTGTYRVGFLGKNAGMQISRADGADFILKELEVAQYLHQMPVVSY